MKNISGMILAGGLGKRMKSDLPKVCHSLGGVPMIERVRQRLDSLGIKNIGIICGKYKDVIKGHVLQREQIQWLNQEVALGTGHAVKCGIEQINTDDKYILIMSGDAPLISEKSLRGMIKKVEVNDSSACLLTCFVSNPFGYGRIIKENDVFNAIVEEKDATSEQRLINEVNAGVYIFKVNKLRKYIQKINNNNVQNEYYLTDIFKIMIDSKEIISVHSITDEKEIFNINTKEQLEKAEKLMN